MEPSQVLLTEAHKPMIFMVFNIIRSFKIFTTHEFYFISFHLLKLYYKGTLQHSDDLHFVRLILSGRHAKIGDYLYKRLQPLRRNRAKILDLLLSRMSGRDKQYRPSKPIPTGGKDGKLDNVESKNRTQDSRVDLDSGTPIAAGSSSSASCTHATVKSKSDEKNRQKSSKENKCATKLHYKQHVSRREHCLPNKHLTDGVEGLHGREVLRDADIPKRYRQPSDSDSVPRKRSRSIRSVQENKSIEICPKPDAIIEYMRTLSAQMSNLCRRIDELQNQASKPDLEPSEVIQQLGSYFDDERKRRSARLRDAYAAVTTEFLSPEDMAVGFYENGIIPGGPIPASALGLRPNSSG